MPEIRRHLCQALRMPKSHPHTTNKSFFLGAYSFLCLSTDARSRATEGYNILVFAGTAQKQLGARALMFETAKTHPGHCCLCTGPQPHPRKYTQFCTLGLHLTACQTPQAVASQRQQQAAAPASAAPSRCPSPAESVSKCVGTHNVRSFIIQSCQEQPAVWKGFLPSSPCS